MYTHAAAKDLDAIPEPDRRAIEQALDVYAQTGRGDVKPLADRNGFRLRVGRYRVIFIEDGQVTVLVI